MRKAHRTATKTAVVAAVAGAVVAGTPTTLGVVGSSTLTVALPTPVAAPPTAASPLSPLSPLAAVPVTLQPVAIPGGAVVVPVGASLASAVAAAPAGTAFAVTPGIHRGEDVIPKAGDSFLGEPGAVLDGSRVVGGFTRQGNAFVASASVPQGQRLGECSTTAPQCAYPEDLFADGHLLTRAAGVNDLGPSRYWIDYAKQQVWLGFDPGAQLIEMAVTPHAFSGTAPDVTVAGLIVQKYATPAQQGAVDGSQATGWRLQGVAANDNHGSGIVIGDHGTVTNCQTLRNGQQGLGGTGDDVVVDNCEIAGNNTVGYAPGWSAGGTKFANTENLLVENCFVHDNHGPGLWTDVNGVNTTYRDNLVQDNDGEGIFEEISYGARITGNTVLRNGRGGSAWVFGAGIQVASSPNVEVDHNYLDGNPNSISGSQQNRGTGPGGPHLLANLWVHDNVVAGGGPVAVADDTGSSDIFTGRGNRFDDNIYAAGQSFGWANLGSLTGRQWQGYGEDVHGTIG